jgi:ribonucleoside-diphosphate reductase alpha chain
MHNDPGVFFIDRVERDNNGWWAYKMDRCNPCLAGGTLIQTDKGLLPIQEVYSRMENGEEFSALSFDTSLNKEEYQVIEKAYLTKKNAEVIKLIIQEGPVEYEIICTPDHKIFTKNRGYVEARHLTGEDDIAVRQ